MTDDDVIWGRAIDTKRANASTTKMATALVVARAGSLETTVTVSPRAAATGGGGVDLSPGDHYTRRELLYALLLSSSNDAAVALAEDVAGSEGAFVRAMNTLARDLDAEGSHFVTPHGLDVRGHYSTARDLARIALAVLRSPLLARIVSSTTAEITGSSGTVRLRNSNPLLETYSGAIGVKTGFTSEAGDVLVGAAVRAGRRLVAVAMGSQDAAEDARALLDYGFRVLGSSVLVREGAPVGAVVFDPSGAVGIVASRTITGYEGAGKVSITFTPNGRLSPPLAGGETVGSVVITGNDGDFIARAPAIASESFDGSKGGGIGGALGALLRVASRLARGTAW